MEITPGQLRWEISPNADSLYPNQNYRPEHRPAPGRVFVASCDGTTNHRDGKPSGHTNVKILHDLILTRTEDGDHVHTRYFAGVGTGSSKRGDSYRDGMDAATGAGIEYTIKEVYRWLCEHEAWRQNDKMILTGFSRGAHTARAVALLITDLGLMTRRSLRDRFDAAFEHWIKYRGSENSPTSDEWMQDWRNSLLAESPAAVYYPVWVDTVAVWDTVGTMGMPWPGVKPKADQKLGFVSSRIGNMSKVYHAMSIDEQRKDFPVNLFGVPNRVGQIVEQMWFRGTHSDVGGGANPYLANIPLVWMISKLQFELVFDTKALSKRLRTTVVDASITKSWTGKYKTSPRVPRELGTAPGSEQVHISVSLLRGRVKDSNLLRGPYDAGAEYPNRKYWQIRKLEHPTQHQGTLWESDPNDDAYFGHEKPFLEMMGLPVDEQDDDAEDEEVDGGEGG